MLVAITKNAVVFNSERGSCETVTIYHLPSDEKIQKKVRGYKTARGLFAYCEKNLTLVSHHDPLQIPPIVNDGNAASPHDISSDTSGDVSQSVGEVPITSLETASQDNDNLPSNASLSAVSSSFAIDDIPEFIETEYVSFPDNDTRLVFRLANKELRVCVSHDYGDKTIKIECFQPIPKDFNYFINEPPKPKEIIIPYSHLTMQTLLSRQTPKKLWQEALLWQRVDELDDMPF